MIVNQPDNLSLTVADACRTTGLGKTYLYELIRDGRVKSVKLGRRRLITTASLRALIEQAG